MNKLFVLGTAAVLAGALALPLGAEEISECYKKSDTQVAYGACLKKELKALEDDYDSVVERVMTQARELDRIQRRKLAAKAFTESNKSFDNYVRQECEWVEASYGSGAGSSTAALACRINLIRIRMGSLETQFLKDN